MPNIFPHTDIFPWVLTDTKLNIPGIIENHQYY